MRQMLVAFLATFSVLLTVTAQERKLQGINRSYTPRIALVIGNSSYPEGPLLNPVNDAKDMAKTLSDLGFKVVIKENLTKKDMIRAIQDFGESIRHGGVSLFFYAGHGVQIEGKNYLIPVDASISSGQDVEFESVDVDYVLAQIENAGNDLNIMILDACRTSPFTRKLRSLRIGLAAIPATRIAATSETFIAYATAPGKEASDGAGSNGLYTGELLKALRRPGLKLEEVFKQARAEVMIKSNGKQIPWESSSLIGDFYFSGRPATIPVRFEKLISGFQWLHTKLINSKSENEYSKTLAEWEEFAKPYMNPDTKPYEKSGKESDIKVVNFLLRVNLCLLKVDNLYLLAGNMWLLEDLKDGVVYERDSQLNDLFKDYPELRSRVISGGRVQFDKLKLELWNKAGQQIAYLNSLLAQ